MEHQFSAVYEESDGWFVAWVEELPGVNTQGETLAEARINLQEAIRLVLEANRSLSEEELVGKSVIRETLQITV